MVFQPILGYLYQQVKELRSLYIHIYIFFFVFGQIGYVWGLYVCYLVGSVDVRPYSMGIAPNIISTTNTTQNFTTAWKKWNRTQRTLNNNLICI